MSEMTGKKEEFTAMFVFATRTHPKSYYDSKDFKGFARALNNNPTLRASFREAFEEWKSTQENSEILGIENLFAGFDKS